MGGVFYIGIVCEIQINVSDGDRKAVMRWVEKKDHLLRHSPMSLNNCYQLFDRCMDVNKTYMKQQINYLVVQTPEYKKMKEEVLDLKKSSQSNAGDPESKSSK